MTVLLQALFDKRNSEDVMEERLLEKLQSIVDSGQVDPPPGKTYYLPTVQKAEALVQAIPDDTSRCPCFCMPRLVCLVKNLFMIRYIRSCKTIGL